MTDLHKKDDFEEAFNSPRDVKIAEVEVAIGAKRISSKGEELEKEVNRYNDWRISQTRKLRKQ